MDKIKNKVVLSDTELNALEAIQQEAVAGKLSGYTHTFDTPFTFEGRTFDTLTFDFGYINSGALDSAGHLWIELLRKSSNDLASEYAKKETSYNEKLSALLEAYR